MRRWETNEQTVRSKNNQLNERENHMNTETRPTAYVTEDGDYGESEDMLLFHSDALTKEQWTILSWVRGNDRYEYVKAILEGDLETVAEYNEEYEPVIAKIKAQQKKEVN